MDHSSLLGAKLFPSAAMASNSGLPSARTWPARAQLLGRSYLPALFARQHAHGRSIHQAGPVKMPKSGMTLQVNYKSGRQLGEANSKLPSKYSSTGCQNPRQCWQGSAPWSHLRTGCTSPSKALLALCQTGGNGKLSAGWLVRGANEFWRYLALPGHPGVAC